MTNITRFTFKSLLVNDIPDDILLAIRRLCDCNKDVSPKIDNLFANFPFYKLNNNYAVSNFGYPEKVIRLDGEFRSNYEMILAFMAFISPYIIADDEQILGNLIDEDHIHSGVIRYEADYKILYLWNE